MIMDIDKLDFAMFNEKGGDSGNMITCKDCKYYYRGYCQKGYDVDTHGKCNEFE